MTLEERKNWLEKNRNEILEHQRKVDEDSFYNMLKDTDEKQRWTNHFGHEPTIEDWYTLMETNTILENTFLNKPLSECSEKINEIDLKETLAKIRKQEIEHLIVLLIKDGEIVKEYEYQGRPGSVPIKDEQFKEMAKEAKRLNANIYDVHNHPFRIVANASHGDKNVIDKRFRPICEKYGVKILDWGVVTECDYYSAKEKENL